MYFFLNPIPPGHFEGGSAWGGGGGGRKVPAAYTSLTINDNEMKFGGVVKDNHLVNLVRFNWRMTSLHHNDVTTVKILSFYKNFNQRRKV